MALLIKDKLAVGQKDLNILSPREIKKSPKISMIAPTSPTQSTHPNLISHPTKE